MEKVLRIAKEYLEERIESIKKIEKNLETLAKRAKKLLGKETKIYVFGSYVKGNFDKFLSDVDVLIVSKRVEKFKNMLERAEVIAKLKKGIKGAYIFEIHLVAPSEFEYYKFFVDKMTEIKTKKEKLLDR